MLALIIPGSVGDLLVEELRKVSTLGNLITLLGLLAISYVGRYILAAVARIPEKEWFEATGKTMTLIIDHERQLETHTAQIKSLETVTDGHERRLSNLEGQHEAFAGRHATHLVAGD